MLELDDIQHILLTRTPALTGEYVFVSFRNPTSGRAWLNGLVDKVRSAAEVQASLASSKRWVTLAFTWNGLRALGLDEASLCSFPDEFKQGMAARAEMLGDTGSNHPDHWVGGLASPDLHAIAILFARDDEERARCVAEHANLVAQCNGVEVLSSLELQATPPYEYAHDHFGYRDRLSQPVMEGSGEQPTPGSGAPLKPGEFILGYPDEDGPPVHLPQPEVLSRTTRDLDEQTLRAGLFECIDRVVTQADEMKRREGRALGEDLQKRITHVAASLARVKELAPSVPREAKVNLESRLRKLAPDVKQRHH